jgi:hypothetical protein
MTEGNVPTPRRGGPAEEATDNRPTEAVAGTAAGSAEEIAQLDYGRGGRIVEGGAEPDYCPVRLSAALHDTVARIGTGGPPAAGLIRIRRVARIRRRRRAVLASGFSVLLAAVAVSAAISDGFAAISALVIAPKPHGTRPAPAAPSGSPQGEATGLSDRARTLHHPAADARTQPSAG